MAKKSKGCGSRDTNQVPCPRCEENDCITYMVSCRAGCWIRCDCCGARDRKHGCDGSPEEDPTGDDKYERGCQVETK